MPILTSELTAGVPASTVLQTLIGTMISPGKKSGISSVTNAGKLVEHTYLFSNKGNPLCSQ